MPAKRIGIYGGAFDPPHLAHVGLAAAAVAQLQLDLLYVIPTGQPWMKQRRLSSSRHRMVMAQLAFASLPQVQVDDCEVQRGGTTYTIDTLSELQERHAARHEQEVEWFLLMGQDLLLTLPQWQRAEDLLGQVTVAVLARPDEQRQGGRLEQDLQRLRQQLPALRTDVLQLPSSDFSSTRIRAGVQQHQHESPEQLEAWLQTLVPPAVAQYIAHHKLYLSPDTLMATERSAVKKTPPKPPVREAPPETDLPVRDEDFTEDSPAAAKMIQKLQRAIVDGLEDVKAQNILVYNTAHLSPLFERVIIASGTSNRQTKALAASVRDAVREAGFPKPRSEGEENGEWIIVDCGSAVVHVMQPAIRQYYMLEDIWGEKPVRMRLGKPAASRRQPAAAKPATAAKPAAARKPRATTAKPAADAATTEAKPATTPRRRTASAAPEVKLIVGKTVGSKPVGKA